MSGTTEPVLVEGLDQVLLIRLYPTADGLTDAAALAVAQGAQTAADGAALEGSQYEPVLMVDADDDAGGGTPPPTEAPVNVDVPHVSQAGATMSCTMGNWQGEPTSYAYQWKMDGTDIPSDGASLPLTQADLGQSVTCVVTATNAAGSTAAPPSNAVVVTEPAR
jgi:hypothetical protein